MSRGNTDKNSYWLVSAEKYWLVSAVRGALSLIAGLVLAFSNTRRLNSLTIFVAVGLSALFIVDLLDIFIRKKAKKNILPTIATAAMELILVNLLFASTFEGLMNKITYGTRIICLAIFAIIYSILTIIRGFKNHGVGPDRFILVVDGLVGAAAGIAMFAGHFYEMTYVLIFGLFLMVDGLTSIIFAVSNKPDKKGVK